MYINIIDSIRSIFTLHGLFSLACAIIPCVIWQAVFFTKRRRKDGKRIKGKHLIAVYIFLIYLTFIYRITGLIGFVWWICSLIVSCKILQKITKLVDKDYALII